MKDTHWSSRSLDKAEGFSMASRRETRPECTHKHTNLILPGHTVTREEAADDRQLKLKRRPARWEFGAYFSSKQKKMWLPLDVLWM